MKDSLDGNLNVQNIQMIMGYNNQKFQFWRISYGQFCVYKVHTTYTLYIT